MIQRSQSLYGVRSCESWVSGIRSQRGKIQEESLYYEQKKHDGSLPLIGVNTFLPREHAGDITTTIELIRSTEGEKKAQIDNVAAFNTYRNATLATTSASGAATGADTLRALQKTARDRGNVFAALMEAVKYNSLGRISHSLYEVGGEYRRNM